MYISRLAARFRRFDQILAMKCVIDFLFQCFGVIGRSSFHTGCQFTRRAMGVGRICPAFLGTCLVKPTPRCKMNLLVYLQHCLGFIGLCNKPMRTSLPFFVLTFTVFCLICCWYLPFIVMFCAGYQPEEKYSCLWKKYYKNKFSFLVRYCGKTTQYIGLRDIRIVKICGLFLNNPTFI